MTLIGRNLPENYGLSVQRGAIPGEMGYRSLGYNDSIGTTLEDITTSGMTVINIPSSAVAMECISDNAADTGVVLVSGTATGGSSTTLVDTGANFVASGVVAGDYVFNDTEGCFAVVATVATTTLTFADPLSCDGGFTAGDAYRVGDVSAGGTGANVMEIHGILNDWTEAKEYIFLNGGTAVATVNNYRVINTYHVMMVGTNGVSVGNVDVREVATPANIANQVAAGGNMSLQTFYMVPSGYTAYITDWSAGSDGTKAVRFILRATVDYLDRAYVPGAFHFQDIIVTDGSDTAHVLTLPLKCPAKSVIKISGNAVGGNGAGGASFGFDLIKKLTALI